MRRFSIWPAYAVFGAILVSACDFATPPSTANEVEVRLERWQSARPGGDGSAIGD